MRRPPRTAKPTRTRHATVIIEYGLLSAMMVMLIMTAATLAETNFRGTFSAVAASLEQPVRALQVSPARAPAVSKRARSPRDPDPSDLPWSDLLQ
jgi:Flp pilus assembly pilin Flp